MLTSATKVVGLLVLLVEASRQDFPFRNVSLPWDVRVDDLVGRLTLDEITPQMAKGGWGNNGPAPAIDRLGIGPYEWQTECLHGIVGRNDTSYPQSIGLAATWSSLLVYKMAEAISIEVRATHIAAEKAGQHIGMSCFSPVINIMRDPRWGRNQETYGEDPYLSGMLSAAYVNGLQGDHPRYMRATAGCKHFNVHGGPDNIPVSRFSFDVKVSIRDWRTTFLPAFRYCVEAGTMSLMCSYNRINGVPACANEELLTNILRKEWGFKGYVVSDANAIENIEYLHHYTNNPIDTVADAVNAGCNLELANANTTDFYKLISQAVQQGKLSEDMVRERVKPLFYTRMRLGEFDPPSMNPYASINTSVIEEASHRDLAVEAAMKSFVLLKNDGVLPLPSSTFNKIAIVGPFANASDLLGGDYNAKPDPKFVTTPLVGLEQLATSTNYAAGCNDTHCQGYDGDSIKAAVSGVEIVFVCLGLGVPVEEEGNDRPDIELPGKQQQLLEDVVANSGSAPVVLITFNAGPVNITWADQNPRVSSIIAAFYPGQGAGVALRNVLTIPGNSTFGRLPYTWFHSADQVPPITNYTMQERTYRYFSGEPLYPFGYGLTYSSFVYSNINVSQVINAGDVISVQLTLQNTGSLQADEVVQIYLSWTRYPGEKVGVPAPRIQLVNFARIPTAPGQDYTFTCNITPENMAVFTEDQGWVVQEGAVYVYAGGSMPYQSKMGRTQFQETVVNINGNKVLGFY